MTGFLFHDVKNKPNLIVALFLFVSSFTALLPQEQIASKEMNAEMLEESVSITVNEKYHVLTHVDFLLKGTIRHQTKMAFPETYWFSMRDFRVLWNNNEIKTIDKVYLPQGQSFVLGRDHYRALYVFSVPSTKGLFSHSVMYQYDAPFIPFDERHEPPMPEGYYIEYVLKTGAPWKGPIHKIAVHVKTKSSCQQIVELADSIKGDCSHGVWKAVYGPVEPKNDVRLIIKK